MYSDYTFSLMLFAFEKHFSTRFLNVFLNFLEERNFVENLFFDLTSLQQHARAFRENKWIKGVTKIIVIIFFPSREISSSIVERLELNSVCPGFLSCFSRDAKIEAIFRLIYLATLYVYRIGGFPITRSPFKPRVASTSSTTESVRSTFVG